jgi:hypothetical protein
MRLPIHGAAVISKIVKRGPLVNEGAYSGRFLPDHPWSGINEILTIFQSGVKTLDQE